mmetsp:Transcript_89423/g.141157  ORF Transcript_89423/g.141157 Transcript_89423/m.141157 type:complete len:85 (+) Transcript_89423:44-298(+)
MRIPELHQTSLCSDPSKCLTCLSCARTAEQPKFVRKRICKHALAMMQRQQLSRWSAKLQKHLMGDSSLNDYEMIYQRHNWPAHR